jgi:CRISPR system Cascade subunit CasA
MGGPGYRTSLRGGGPLSTLVIPQRDGLWRLIWANVPLGEPAPVDASVFPWLAPAVPAGTVVPGPGVHPAQVWWGMPRRYRLLLGGLGTCSITGQADCSTVSRCRKASRGRNYESSVWRHLLTPYRSKPGGQPQLLPVLARGFRGWRDYIGLVAASQDGRSLPAASVARWRADRRRDAGEGPDIRLYAAGVIANQAKILDGVESEMPIPGSADDQPRIDALAGALVAATHEAAEALKLAGRRARAPTPGTLAEALWRETEAGFYAALAASARNPSDPGMEPERAAWAITVRRDALRLFDDASPLGDESSAARIAAARQDLLAGLGRPVRARLGLAEPVEQRRQQDASMEATA